MHAAARWVVAVGALVVAVALPRVARADSDFLAIGYLHSVRWGYGSGQGNGAELTYVHYQRFQIARHDVEELGFGVFAQFEATPHSDEHAFRIGPQLNLAFFGLETGLEALGGDAARRDSTGIYFGTFCSVGLLAIGWHGVAPVDRDRSFRHAFTLAIKLPIPLRLGSYAFWHGGG
jgi:hypothetical protein